MNILNMVILYLQMYIKLWSICKMNIAEYCKLHGIKSAPTYKLIAEYCVNFLKLYIERMIQFYKYRKQIVFYDGMFMTTLKYSIFNFVLFFMVLVRKIFKNKLKSNWYSFESEMFLYKSALGMQAGIIDTEFRYVNRNNLGL